MTLKVLRIYHAGRDAGHRARERALVKAGADVTLVVPASWPDAGSEPHLSAETFKVLELPVRRAGDVNRHAYSEPRALRQVLHRVGPDLLDVHEEPFSLAARQWLGAADDLPAVAYTAQNVDKRLPPPFHQYEQAAYRRLAALYPCSAQAASVARGKGFGGRIEVLPLGYDAEALSAGPQQHADEPFVLGLVGRLVPEKGPLDAVRLLAQVLRRRPAVLVVAGSGPLEGEVRRLAADLGVGGHVELLPWSGLDAMAALYRRMHVVLVPSMATRTWVEQFGRVIVEAQASGAVVVAYASGAIPEVAGEPAVLVAEGDERALADAVVDLASDGDGWRRRRGAGLAASAGRTWDAVAQRQVALYRAALEDPRGAPTAPATGREAAVAEFGPTAALAGGGRRPFALPVLRQDTAVSRLLGAGIDRLSR